MERWWCWLGVHNHSHSLSLTRTHTHQWGLINQHICFPYVNSVYPCVSQFFCPSSHIGLPPTKVVFYSLRTVWDVQHIFLLVEGCTICRGTSRHYFCISFIIFNCLEAVVKGTTEAFTFQGTFEGRTFMEAPIQKKYPLLSLKLRCPHSQGLNKVSERPYPSKTQARLQPKGKLQNYLELLFMKSSFEEHIESIVCWV